MAFSYAYSLKSQEVTLSNCDREPVHVPGCIQPFGILLALRPKDYTVLQASENVEEWLGQKAEAILGKTLSSIVGMRNDKVLHEAVQAGKIGNLPRYVFTFENSHGQMDVLAHLHDGVLIIEAEAANDSMAAGETYAEVNRIAGKLHQTQGLYDFCDRLAHEVRGLTGLDRVMIYRFHEDLSGEVFAEARREDLHSYQSLRYPSEDIPAPARAIFRKIWVRPLPAVHYTQAELVPLLNPDTGQPLDMTHCFLRGASAMYTDYLKNMGVEMALTLSLVVDGQLWGLIACHHTTEKIVPWATRAACELLAQIASLQLRAAENNGFTDMRLSMEHASHALIARMLNEDITIGMLLKSDPAALDFMSASGVAVLESGEWTRHGATPNKAQLHALAEWLRVERMAAPTSTEILHTHALSERHAPAKAYAALVSGLLAAPISRNGEDFIVWFRPELLQTVNWAGDPHSKNVVSTAQGERLMPRTSFALWQESVHEQSIPWNSAEIEAARRLRLSLVEVLVARTERIASLNKELSVSNEELDAFAYVTSHDLREPLRGIYHYAHYLRENAEKREDAESVERTDRLTALVKRMDGLIESLLHFSRVGRMGLDSEEIEMRSLVEETLDILYARIKETQPRIEFVGILPNARGDATRVREIWTNLINNALKYGGSQPWIEIGSQETPLGTAYFVRDHGIGIAAEDQTIIFSLFKRLHAKDAYGGGSGAGLAIVKKVVERHGGTIWIDSTIGQGTTFYFTLREAE